MKKRRIAPESAGPAQVRRSSESKLTAKERAVLKDPEWITEDEADLIMAMRREAEGGLTVPLEDWLAKHGR